MPPRRQRPCREPGCSALTDDRSGYCEQHRGSNWSRYQAGLTRHQRGYGAEWDKVRLVILNRDSHLCQPCIRAGIYTPAKMVDHIVAKAHGGTDSPSNLESICTACHAAKTSRERLKGK